MINISLKGALTSKIYNFKARPWEVTSTIESNFFDITGNLSKLSFDFRGNNLLRILPFKNISNNETWITDIWRYSFLNIKKKFNINEMFFMTKNIYLKNNNSINLFVKWFFNFGLEISFNNLFFKFIVDNIYSNMIFFSYILNNIKIFLNKKILLNYFNKFVDSFSLINFLFYKSNFGLLDVESLLFLSFNFKLYNLKSKYDHLAGNYFSLNLTKNFLFYNVAFINIRLVSPVLYNFFRKEIKNKKILSFFGKRNYSFLSAYTKGFTLKSFYNFFLSIPNYNLKKHKFYISSFIEIDLLFFNSLNKNVTVIYDTLNRLNNNFLNNKSVLNLDSFYLSVFNKINLFMGDLILKKKNFFFSNNFIISSISNYIKLDVSLTNLFLLNTNKKFLCYRNKIQIINKIDDTFIFESQQFFGKNFYYFLLNIINNCIFSVDFISLLFKIKQVKYLVIKNIIIKSLNFTSYLHNLGLNLNKIQNNSNKILFQYKNNYINIFLNNNLLT